jgi:sigma-E factor negative regulatory protein RseB
MTLPINADGSCSYPSRVSTPVFSRPGRSTLRSLLYVVVVGATALGKAAAEAPTSAEQWLERMAKAAQTLNYDGTFVYRNGVSMQSMRLIHRFDGHSERERLVALSGVAREVLRDSERVTCILPDNQAVVVGKSRPRTFPYSPLFETDDGFSRYYTLSNRQGERIAERHTILVVVDPLDGFRYGYRLWADRDTGLLLKSELVGTTGEAIEQIVYTNIKMPSEIPDTLLEPEISGAGYTWYRNESETQVPTGRASSPWRPRWLPEGFALQDHARDPIKKDTKPVEHMVFSDGLASVSLFIERLDSTAEPLDGLSTMGAVNAYGRMVDGHQVTVVGEVPATTVERIAASVR